MYFSTTPKIISGKGSLSTIGDYIPKLATKALIVSGKSSLRNGKVNFIMETLEKMNIKAVSYSDITSEPTIDMIEEGVKIYTDEECDFLIGIGGGSPMDAMKAIAMKVIYEGPLSSYMGKQITDRLPFMIAVPTTAGTGSEVTKFTIITDTENDVKMLLAGESLYPDVAIVDPLLTETMPLFVTVSSGLDALTHATEAYTSKKAQPLSDTIALDAVCRIFESLPRIIRKEEKEGDRESMAIASLEAGIAFSNSSVTLVHGMSRPIGALFHVEHGISNAMLLDVCLSYAKEGAVERFAKMGRAIGVAYSGDSNEVAADSYMQAVRDLCRLCKVPTLEGYGINKEKFFENITKMASDAVKSGSPGNTRMVTNEKILEDLYRKLWD